MSDRSVLSSLFRGWGMPLVRTKKAGGQTNRNYMVQTRSGATFFTRLPWERGDLIDRRAEGKNILALSRNAKTASIIPDVFLYAFEGRNILDAKDRRRYAVPDGTMIAEYVAGREFTLSDFRNRRLQQALAETFYQFHTSGVKFANAYDVFVDEIEKYRREAKKLPLGEVAEPATVALFETIEEEAKGKLKKLPRSAPAHNDFIFQNFLLDQKGKVWLLDFEYAGQSSRGGMYYDFGFLFADNLFRRPKMSPAIFEEFLQVADAAYGKKLDRDQIYSGALATIVMQFWWGILRYFSSSTKKDRQYFKTYALSRKTGIEAVHGLLET